jgi:hypothetical protein
MQESLVEEQKCAFSPEKSKILVLNVAKKQPHKPRKPRYASQEKLSEINIIYKGQPYTVTLPSYALLIFKEYITDMYEYFSIEGVLRLTNQRGNKPDYSDSANPGYLYHYVVRSKRIIQEISRRLSTFKHHMRQNLLVLIVEYQAYSFSSVYPLEDAIF